MKSASIFIAMSLLLAGCASSPSERRVTNPQQPGPAIGKAVGTVVGAVGGNVAGAAVGVVEGAAGAAKAPFNNEKRVVRTWRTEQTSDGRTIQVPVEVEVDAEGRPISAPTNK